MFKNIFFNFKKSKLIYILFLLIIILWGVIFSQSVSSIGFKKNFIAKYENNLPVNNGVILKINILHDLQVENKEKFVEELKKIIGTKQKNQEIDTLMAESYLIDKNNFNVDLSKYKRNFIAGSDNGIEFVNMNYEYLEFLKNKINIDETISLNSDEVPIIMGSEFSKKFKINDLIESTDQKLKVIGFFEKDSFYVDGPSAAMYFRPLDSAIVIPNKNFVSMNYAIINAKNSNFDIHKLKKELNSLANVEFAYTFTEELDRFFYSEGAKENNKILTIKLIFMSFLNIMVINGIITFIINKNKKKIGIIYAVGGNISLIFKQLLKECSTILLLGVLIGIPINYKFTEYSFMHFLNESRIFTVVNASVVLSVVVSINIILSLLYLRKFSTSELIGGLRDE